MLRTLIETHLLLHGLRFDTQSTDFVGKQTILKFHLSNVVFSLFKLLCKEVVLFCELLVEIIHVAEHDLSLPPG